MLFIFKDTNILPAVAFTPAENHEIELPITLINQVPCVSAGMRNMSNVHGKIWCIMSQLYSYRGVKGWVYKQFGAFLI